MPFGYIHNVDLIEPISNEESGRKIRDDGIRQIGVNRAQWRLPNGQAYDAGGGQSPGKTG
jgi:hypothetical protein